MFSDFKQQFCSPLEASSAALIMPEGRGNMYHPVYVFVPPCVQRFIHLKMKSRQLAEISNFLELGYPSKWTPRLLLSAWRNVSSGMRMRWEAKVGFEKSALH